MEYVLLGSTGLLVSRTGFGCLPIQRIADRKTAKNIIHAAYDAGINFYDTARAYTDSESKLGDALHDVRQNIIIASKSMAKTGDGVYADLLQSLTELRTDYIDLFQIHNPAFIPKPNGDDGIYEVLLRAKTEGKIRFLGITNHSRERALETTLSGLYNTVQYPFSLLASEDEKKLVTLCGQMEIGFIAMKALCGGLLNNVKLAFSFLRQYEHVVPIWGIQAIEELQEIVSYEVNPPALDDEAKKEVESEKEKLAGNFCRSCGYCLPCPAGIPIEQANRMTQLLNRTPQKLWLTDAWHENMQKIKSCTKCGACEKKCPYGLKPYETLPQHLAFFEEQWAKNQSTT